MSQYTEAYAEVFEALGIRLTPEDGCPETELLEAEDRLALSIPDSLRSYYRLAGRERILNHAHNHLLRPAEWALAGQHLTFLDENQGVVVWAIDTANSEDPPVFQGSSSEGDEWHPEHDSCARFLRVMLHWQAAMGPRHLACVSLVTNVEPSLDDACRFAGQVGELRAYSQDGVAVCSVKSKGSWQLWVAGSAPSARRVLADVGVDWDTNVGRV